MAIHKLTLAVDGSGINKSKTISSEDTAVVLIDGETVADSQTDQEIECALDVSKVKSFYLVSDQDVTFETNNGAAADDTIALKADEPYVWHTNSYDSFLLDTDVTAVFITNASGATATIHMVALLDGTAA